MSNKQYLLASSAAALLTAVLWTGVAQAQTRPATAAAAAAAAPKDVEEVVVTGSFIAGTPEDSAIPVEAVTLEELRNQGTPSNLDLVKNMSEIGGVAGEANRSNLFAVGAASINLRGVGSSRTVVVFNGRRLPDQYSFSVGRFNNINVVPNAAIGRVETLKDGGATTYGADAVGGVVNYITRKNLDGLEVNANYRYIQNSSGDYDGDVSWGKIGDNWNAMAVVGYARRNVVNVRDRDFALQPYLINPAGWSGYGNPGGYSFQRAGQGTTGAGVVITPAATAASGNQYTGNYQMGATGVVRDPACTALGGFAGFSATPSPICYFETNLLSNLVEKQNTWQAYGEVNYRFNDSLKVHVEGLYYDVDVPEIPLDTFVSVPLVFPIAAGSATGATQTIGSAAYGVAGSNPAVRQLLSTIKNSDGSLAFGDPNVATSQAFQIINGGRVGLNSATWRPWGYGANPVPETDLQHNRNTIYRTTVEFSGDLPHFLGMDLQWSAAGTFNFSKYSLKFNDISSDKLQLALNGLGGAGCNVAANTPGANGCQYFNPFPSAYPTSIQAGQTNPSFVGTGNFTGYVAGQGLQNSQDLVKWLYYPIELRRQGEYSVYDFLISGETPIKLWAKNPVSIAVGAQYRYFREQIDLSDMAERAKFPCATPPTVTAQNPSGLPQNQACATRSGPGLFSRGSGVTGFTNDLDRRYPRASAFFEIQAPIFDGLIANVSGRYEKFFSDLPGGVDNAVFVPQGSLKWQITDWIALRGTIGKTFSNVDPPAKVDPISTTAGVPTEFGGTALLIQSLNYANTAVKPETGLNYNVGTIVQLGNFRANLDYYNIKIDGLIRAQTTNQLVTALVQPGQLGVAALINCSSPLLTEKQALLGGNPFVQLNGPCVSGTSRLNSPAGGGGISQASGAFVNFFGPQGGYPALVNGGSLETSGIDLSASYFFDEVFGGRLTLSGDWSHLLTYTNSDFVVGGVVVAKGYDGLGQVNETTGRVVQHLAEDRASVSFNYKWGRHTFNWSTRFVSAMINDDVTDFVEANQLNANIGVNGVVPTGAACVDTNPTSPPVPAGAGTGQFGNVGATPGFCAGQNVAITNYREIPDQFTTDVTYQVSLPWDTTLTLTVQNLFDADPGFSRDVVGYDASTNSPLGRTYRLGVRKRF